MHLDVNIDAMFMSSPPVFLGNLPPSVKEWIVDHITAKSYVQTGLIAMWDGIENAGYGKSDDQNRLVDLTGNNVNLTLDEKSSSSFKTRRIISAKSLVDVFANGTFTFEVVSKLGF